MTQFPKPKGLNFSCVDNLPAAVLSKALCKTASFLQGVAPYAELHRFEDWLEHDGLHFYREAINFDRLFEILHSPRSLLEMMPGDDDVFIGIAPDDRSWYLRFYLSWDDEGFDLLGRYDLTLPMALAQRYRNEVVELCFEMVSQDSETYYQSITV